MSAGKGKGAKTRPQPMKMNQIHIPKKDYPESGEYPPKSGSFDDLKKSLKLHGMLTPVFVNADGVLLQGHYRFWAWQALGNKHVPAVVVESVSDIYQYFD